MSRDEYGRGPVLQTVDKAVAFIRWDWVAEFVFILAAYTLVRIIADSRHESWLKAAGLFSMMVVAVMAYLVGTRDRGTYSKRDRDEATR
ncbi:hypothetical protein [Dietzia alimentaria]|uniref:hypothetical protein n=1 Tax=Dietzia alimentaria TaxID=665550 RepID=UPI00029AC346|nr:hypothetical protein [Dietzia alimentaria]